MKKLAFSALLAATLLGATDYNYEISPMVGYVFPNSAQDLKNHAAYGAEMQFNNVDTLLKPELSVLFSNADYKPAPGSVDIFRSALNGVYDLKTSNNITPFVKAGLGYETMSNHQYNNHNSVFADAGAGVKVGLSDQIALKLEAIEMLKFNHFNWDNNLLLMAGLDFAFGEKAQPVAPAATPIAAPVVAAVVAAPVVAAVVAPTPAPKPVIAAPKDSDKDGVFDDKDQCPNSPAGFVVDAKGCNIDSDKDGVLDPADKCPNTPAGFKVDMDGCPLSATLHLNFATNSNAVDAEGTAKVAAFASFLKDSPAYKASIVGHTDSTASDAYNQKLSEKRAEAVKSMLTKDGVDAERLSSSGKGESMPIATNNTKEGRAENRRIEVQLTK
ncbi:MAG: OmpA family protein [Sulfuricurvum sp.]|nr:OmpA family protein [Sulfuricurvum sp.]